MNKYLAAVFLLICLMLSPKGAMAAKADLPEYIRNQLHNDISYTVITEKNLDIIDTLQNKKKHFIVVQANPDVLKSGHLEKLISWVREGGILWFYDSRMAESFGMRNSPLEKDKINGQNSREDYGNAKVPGITVIAYTHPQSETPVVSGIQSVQVFLMETGDKTYSAVADDTPGTIPRLQTNLEKKVVAAMRKEGKGWIIFKPLIWLDRLGGERLQANLLEFSGGYSVPAGENPVISMDDFQGKPVKLPRYDSLILSDGQQVMGMVMNDKIEFMGEEGNTTQNASEIESVKISSTGDEMIKKDGKSFTGSLMAISIDLKTPTGKLISIDKQKISKITFGVSAEKR